MQLTHRFCFYLLILCIFTKKLPAFWCWYQNNTFLITYFENSVTRCRKPSNCTKTEEPEWNWICNIYEFVSVVCVATHNSSMSSASKRIYAPTSGQRLLCRQDTRRVNKRVTVPWSKGTLWSFWICFVFYFVCIEKHCTHGHILPGFTPFWWLTLGGNTQRSIATKSTLM